jgi:hypothetical protein
VKRSNYHHAQRIDVWCKHFEPFKTFLKQDPVSKKDCADCVLHNNGCPYENENMEGK